MAYFLYNLNKTISSVGGLGMLGLFGYIAYKVLGKGGLFEGFGWLGDTVRTVHTAGEDSTSTNTVETYTDNVITRFFRETVETVIDDGFGAGGEEGGRIVGETVRDVGKAGASFVVEGLQAGYNYKIGLKEGILSGLTGFPSRPKSVQYTEALLSAAARPGIWSVPAVLSLVDFGISQYIGNVSSGGVSVDKELITVDESGTGRSRDTVASGSTAVVGSTRRSGSHVVTKVFDPDIPGDRERYIKSIGGY